MRALTLAAVMLGSTFLTVGAAQAQDAASAATIAANRAVAARLPLGDTSDFADATRGKIAEITDGVILDAKGGTVWDWRPYAFLDAAEAPPSVNPSLWRQARLNHVHGLFEVVPGKIWQVRGYDISVMTIIAGKRGWIVIDPLTTEETARAAFALFESKVPKRPISAILFTHSHSDHFGGVGGIVTADQVRKQKIRIIAPHGFAEEAVAENVIAGPAMQRRAGYMFGSSLTPGPAGQVDTGLGPRLPNGTIGYMTPTETVPKTGGKLTIDGLAFDFIDAGGTEAPSEFLFYIPAYRALHTAEVTTKTLHNVLTLRGAQVRDALFWSKVIDSALQRFGGTAEVQLASHNWPTWGRARIATYLTDQRDIYRYVHDRTLFAANNGATLHEVADGVAEPAALQSDFAARGYYGTINHNMKAVYQRYFGWWDGNPANFNPLPPAQSAVKYVALMGGADKVAAAGQAAIDAGDYRWAAELLGRLVFAEPDNARGRALLASAYDQLGYQAESGPWRNYYLGAAATLRGTELPRVIGSGRTREFVSAIPTRAIFDALATRFDAVKGAGITGTFQFVLPDTGETVEVQVAGGVEFPRVGSRAAQPTATITIDRKTLDDISLGTANFAALMQSGAIRIDGDRAALLGWFALHPPANARFNIVVP